MNKIIILIICLASLGKASQVHAQNTLQPNSKFEVIENIRLGLTKEVFLNELKSLKIQNKNFSSNLILKNFWLEKENQENNLINFFYTQTFNFDEYKVPKKFIEHPSIIYSESIDNKIITSIILLLGHTGKVVGYTKKDSLEGNIHYFRQDINQELFSKIINLYELKYGKPEWIQDSTVQKKYYRLYKNNVISEDTESYKNFILKWRTEFFNIEIFPGFNNNAFYVPNEAYSASSNWVSSNLNDGKLEDNQRPCFTFPYVKYELNEKALKILGVDKLRI